MTLKRLAVALPILVCLAACGSEAPTNDSRSASGEVLEGTISDAMLPVDQVRSEPPLVDPKAFAKAQSDAGGAGPEAGVEGEGDEAAEAPAGETGEAPAEEPAAAPTN
jgi:hypothetical protein